MKRKKTYTLLMGFLGGLLLLSILSSTGFAEIPGTMNYQGYLTDTNGPVDGQRSMTFRIYDNETAITDDAIWTEVHTDVQLNQGVYSIVLGSVNLTENLLDFPFDTQYWLGVEVATDGEMIPRQPLTSVPYAFHAAYVDSLEARIEALEQIISTHFSRSGDDIYITGANLHVRSGGNSTIDTVDGTGNIIIGFNEPRGSGSDKTGSHNLVVGKNHNYSSYGGIVIGFNNTISAPYASVSGGEFNTASMDSASVSGGVNNTAFGRDSSISGGQSNIASENGASVSGGESNTASGFRSSVSGGNSRSVSGIHDWQAGSLFQDQ